MTSLFLHVGQPCDASNQAHRLIRRNRELLGSVHYVTCFPAEPPADASRPSTAPGRISSRMASLFSRFSNSDISPHGWLDRISETDNLVVSDSRLYQSFVDEKFLSDLEARLHKANCDLSVFLCLQDPLRRQMDQFRNQQAVGNNGTMADYLAQRAVTNQKNDYQRITALLQFCQQRNYPVTVVHDAVVSGGTFASDRQKPKTIGGQLGEQIGTFLQLPEETGLKLKNVPARRPLTRFETGVTDELIRVFESLDSQFITATVRKAVSDNMQCVLLAETLYPLNNENSAIAGFNDAIRHDTESINALLPDNHRFNLVEDVELSPYVAEMGQLDKSYGQLFAATVAKNILYTLSLNTGEDASIRALEVICDHLTSSNRQSDMRFWNAYAKALEEKNDERLKQVRVGVNRMRGALSGKIKPDSAARTSDLNRKNTTRTSTTPKQSKKILLHIGHSKTGSSFLQSVLALNQRTLANVGIHYPLLPMELKRATSGRVTSGNRRILDDPDQFAEALAQDASVLFSNETMWRRFQDVDFLEQIATAADNTNREVAVLLCLRDPVEHAQSRYMQLSQTRERNHSISQFMQAYAVRHQLDLFEAINCIIDTCRNFGFELTIHNYSSIRRQLLDHFRLFLELPEDLQLASRIPRVNRSLNVLELGTRRTMTKLYKGNWRLPPDNDYLRELIEATADMSFSLPRPTEEALQRFVIGIGDDLDDINKRLPDAAHYSNRETLLSASPVSDDDSDVSMTDSPMIHYGSHLCEAIASVVLEYMSNDVDNDDDAVFSYVRNRLSGR